MSWCLTAIVCTLAVASACRPDESGPNASDAVASEAGDGGTSGSPSVGSGGSSGTAGGEGRERSLWNGVDLGEWDGDPEVWRVEAGALIGSQRETLQNTYLVYRGGVFSDFVLRAEIWLEAGGNSGIQYRSAITDDAAWVVGGYQADAADGYWGMLYDELGRGTLVRSDAACLAAAAHDRWNDYEIRAEAGFLVHHVNGVECIRFEEDSSGARAEGVIALQYHAPGNFEVRFRSLTLTELGAPAH